MLIFLKKALRSKRFLLGGCLACAALGAFAAPVYTVRFFSPGVKASEALRFSSSTGGGLQTIPFLDTVEESVSPTALFTVQNTSPYNVVFAATPFSAAAPFAVTSTTCGATLVPTASCTISMSFAPTRYGRVTGNYLTINTTSATVNAPPLSAKGKSLPIVAVVTDGNSTFIKKTNNKWYGAGANIGGQLGLPLAADTSAFQQIPGIQGAVEVTMGSYSTIARMADGSIKATGDNSYGELGLNDTIDRDVFTPVPGMAGIVKVVPGFLQYFLQNSSGTWYAAGNNASGSLAVGTSGMSQTTFITGPNFTGVTSVAATAANTFLRYSSGWKGIGGNNSGILGLGDSLPRTVPTPIPTSTLLPGADIYTNLYGAIAKQNDGSFAYAGVFLDGELGNGVKFNSKKTFTPLTSMTNATTLLFDTLPQDSLIKLPSGDWYGAGSNQSGALCLGDTLSRLTMTSIPSLKPATTVVKSGRAILFAIMPGGVLYACGDNSGSAAGSAATYTTLTTLTSVFP